MKNVAVKQVPMISKLSHYAKNPNLAGDLVTRIQSWADSVPSGTSEVLWKVMNFGGHPSFMPVETWMDPFKKGLVQGVELLPTYGPGEEHAFGMPHLVHKI